MFKGEINVVRSCEKQIGYYLGQQITRGSLHLALVTAVGVGLLVFLKKRKHQTEWVCRSFFLEDYFPF